MKGFSGIIGQDKPKKMLKQAMSSGSLPHAFLFNGIEGIGKSTAARALCMALNCLNPIDNDACGRCEACRQMINGNFPEFMVIEPQEESQVIKIEQIRDLNRKIAFPPITRYRLFVIRRADRMTTEAANSFLKALEEPPPLNIMVLNTVEPRDLLPTVVSRCRRVRFNPIGIAEIAEWLVKNRDMDHDNAVILAGFSGGSLGRAIELSAGNFWKERRMWISRLMKIAVLPADQAFSVATECADVAKIIGLGGLKRSDVGILDMLEVWESFFRDVMFLGLESPSELIVNKDFSEELKKFAGLANINYLINGIWAIDQARSDLRRARNSRLVIEDTAMTLNRGVFRETLGTRGINE